MNTCKMGHPMTPDNTYHDDAGVPRCETCLCEIARMMRENAPEDSPVKTASHEDLRATTIEILHKHGILRGSCPDDARELEGN